MCAGTPVKAVGLFRKLTFLIAFSNLQIFQRFSLSSASFAGVSISNFAILAGARLAPPSPLPTNTSNSADCFETPKNFDGSHESSTNSCNLEISLPHNGESTAAVWFGTSERCCNVPAHSTPQTAHTVRRCWLLAVLSSANDTQSADDTQARLCRVVWLNGGPLLLAPALTICAHRRGACAALVSV